MRHLNLIMIPPILVITHSKIHRGRELHKQYLSFNIHLVIGDKFFFNNLSIDLLNIQLFMS